MVRMERKPVAIRPLGRRPYAIPILEQTCLSDKTYNINLTNFSILL
jgi:hypothetical protein